MSMHDFVEKPVEEPTDEIEKNVRSEMPSFGHRLIGALMVLSAFCPNPESLNINKDYNVDDSNRHEIVKSIDEIGLEEDKPELFEKDGKTYQVTGNYGTLFEDGHLKITISEHPDCAQKDDELAAVLNDERINQEMSKILDSKVLDEELAILAKDDRFNFELSKLFNSNTLLDRSWMTGGNLNEPSSFKDIELRMAPEEPDPTFYEELYEKIISKLKDAGEELAENLKNQEEAKRLIELMIAAENKYNQVQPTPGSQSELEVNPKAPDLPPLPSVVQYYSEHNYGKEDYDKYSQELEWRRLMRYEFPDAELPALNRETIDNILAPFEGKTYENTSEYYKDHDFSQGEYEVYSQDPEWRRLIQNEHPGIKLPDMIQPETETLSSEIDDNLDNSADVLLNDDGEEHDLLNELDNMENDIENADVLLNCEEVVEEQEIANGITEDGDGLIDDDSNDDGFDSGDFDNDDSDD